MGIFLRTMNLSTTNFSKKSGAPFQILQVATLSGHVTLMKQKFESPSLLYIIFCHLILPPDHLAFRII